MRNELLSLFGRKRSEVLDQSRLPLFMREYLDAATRNTDCNPGLLLTAWLPFIAVNIGNRVYMLSNSLRIYPNIWSCLIGPSSVSRKSTAITYAGYTLKPHDRALEDLPVDEYEAKTLLLSNVTLAKLLVCLAINSTRLFVHHELSAWLAEMGKHFNDGYKQTITELYDGVDKTVRNLTRTDRIKRPAFSIASSTTEAWIYKNIRDNSDQMGGFLQRFLYFVIRDVNLDEIDLLTRSGEDLEEYLGVYDAFYEIFRSLPGQYRLRLGEEAVGVRDEVYVAKYRHWFAKNNDSLMSYFTRIYDGYFYKFCIIITVFDAWDRLKFAIPKGTVDSVMAELEVSAETTRQALYLCDFYFANTIPFLEIVDEQDKLAGERKLVEILIQKYNGKAGHSALLNASHMKKRDFKECIESLIEREAISVESYKSVQGNSGKMYVLARELMDSWGK
ncbi:MAG: DUF3987 domain-containing protein [Candidatus Syntrophosphaera sp.]|nr:DUF3987 domain-containing protein [Candidatus Syntrophosphaera sp.]